jgi:hypothetical protein
MQSTSLESSFSNMHIDSSQLNADSSVTSSICDSPICHEWYWGPTGSGKHSDALRLYPCAYYKRCDLNWDGYNNEEVVVIDGFTVEHSFLLYYLFIWCDRYPFSAEINSVFTKIRPRKIVVISLYPFTLIWPSPMDFVPLSRRFSLIEFVSVSISLPRRIECYSTDN